MALVPVTEFDGPALSFDLEGVEVGVAEYAEGPTGCTVLRFPQGAAMAVDVRGGSVGVIGAENGFTHAICLTGGSLPGLEAVGGVSAALHEGIRGPLRWGDESPFRSVAGAVIYDYGRRENAVSPDHALGRAAASSTRPGSFPQGPRGVGVSAAVGKFLYGDPGAEPGGQGAAFRQVDDTRVLVCTVVNAVGAVLDRQGNPVRGHLSPSDGRRLRVADAIRQGARPGPPRRDTNTTLTVMVTDATLSADALRQAARLLHTSMGRAIDPFHTSTDGDVLFAVSTGRVDSTLSPDALGVVAADVAWDAVLQAVGAAG